MAAFTHYWTVETCKKALDDGWTGKPPDHVGGNAFESRGVRVGDKVYAVVVMRGRLFLIGRMTVGRIVYSDDEARELIGYPPWSAREHLICARDQCTMQRFDRELPVDVVRQLRFESTEGPVPPVFRESDKLDQQTLRGVRKLTASAAALFDHALA